LLHDDKRTAIDERPGFVGALLTEFPGRLVEGSVDLDAGNAGVLTNDVDVIEDPRSGQAVGAVEESDEFGDDVVGGDNGRTGFDRLAEMLGGDQVVRFSGDKDAGPARGIDEEAIRHYVVLDKGLLRCIGRGFRQDRWCRGRGCR
jgi:hypothetical protein